MEKNSQPVATDQDKATQYLYELALKLLELGGSDIFVTAGSNYCNIITPSTLLCPSETASVQYHDGGWRNRQ